MVTVQIIPHLKNVREHADGSEEEKLRQLLHPHILFAIKFEVINRIQSISSNHSFVTTHSPEKHAKSTEIRMIFTAWRNVPAFMEMQ